MSHIRLLLAAASALALAACAPTATSDTSVLPSPVALNNAVSAQSAGADFGANTGGTYPYGSAGGVQTGNAGAGAGTGADAGQEDQTIRRSDGTIWLKPGTANEAYRIDADSCYSYARAQQAHDARIENDAGAAFRDSTGGNGVFELRRRMSQYARSNRVPRVFGQCMEAKGYTRG